MKVLVTGAAGFIGSHVVDALRTRGADVIGIDSLDPGVHRSIPAYLRPDVEYCFADLRTWIPDERFADVELIVHLAALGGVSRAAREPANIIAANAGGTARLVEHARAWPLLRHVILASSFSIYGANYTYRVPSTGAMLDAQRHTEDLERGDFEVRDRATGETAEIVPITASATPGPLETYGASKYMQELCFRGFEHARVTILRFSSVYGGRMRLDDGEATIVAKLAGWIGSGISPQLLEDGRQIRDWVYVGDLVDAVLRISAGVTAPPIINVCSGRPTTLLSACDVLARVLERDVAPRVVGGYRPGDMRHCLGDAASFTQLIGRTPLRFEEGAPLAFGVGQTRVLAATCAASS